MSVLRLTVPIRQDHSSCETGERAVRATGTFTLRIQRNEDHEPTRVAVIILCAMPEADGTVVVTQDCMTLDDVESCINKLQDELDLLRVEARRAFERSVAALE